jgi:iron complex outermembrane recepter protein
VLTTPRFPAWHAEIPLRSETGTVLRYLGPQRSSGDARRLRTAGASYVPRTAAALVFAFLTIAQSLAQTVALTDTVVVWAQKRPIALGDVPMSVTTLTGSDLAAAGIEDLGGVALRLPVFDLQSSVSSVTTTLRVRRIGNLGNIPTFEPAVGLFVDGAFRSRSMLGTADLLDVERIEVLSGPQSTLYGKNASAGVVAIYTKEPAEQMTGRAELTGGWIDQPGSPAIEGLQGGLSGPLSSTWGASVAAGYSRHGHTIQNALNGGPDGNEQSRTTFRGQLVWTPSKTLKVRLIGGHMEMAGDEGESDVYLSPGARSSAVASSLQQLGLASRCPDNVPHNRTTCSVTTNQLDLEAMDLTLIGEYELPNAWKLTSISGWDRYEDQRKEDDVMQLFTPLLYFHDTEQGTTLQEELRLSSSATATVPWLLGVFWYDNEYERGRRGKRPMFGPTGVAAFDPLWQATLRVPLALPGQDGVLDSRLDTEYLGVFGQITWNVTQRLSLTGAARWQRDRKRASIDNSVTLQGDSLISLVLTPRVSAVGAPINGVAHRTFDAWTWSVTPQYRFSDRMMMYATVARDAKSGGFNTGFGNAPLAEREFDDEKIEHYEIGSRLRFTHGRGQLRVAAFSTRYDNYQDAAFIGAQFTVGNVSRADLKGAEMEAHWLFRPHIRAEASVSFADLVYDKNTTGMCYPGRTPNGSLPGSCDLTGEHPTDAPEWEAHLGVEHTVRVGAAELFSRIDWSWSDEYNTSFSADPRLVQEPFHDVGVRVGLRAGKYEIVLSGNNLLDKRIVHFDSVLNFFNDASYQSFLDEARRYRLTLRAQF